MLQAAIGRADVAVPTESASVRELAMAGRNRSLSRRVAGIDPHPSCALKRLSVFFRHLARAVGRDIQQQHVHMADALRNAQTHPALALGLPSAKLFGAPPVSSKIPRLEVGPPAPCLYQSSICAVESCAHTTRSRNRRN